MDMIRIPVYTITIPKITDALLSKNMTISNVKRSQETPATIQTASIRITKSNNCIILADIKVNFVRNTTPLVKLLKIQMIKLLSNPYVLMVKFVPSPIMKVRYRFN